VICTLIRGSFLAAAAALIFALAGSVIASDAQVQSPSIRGPERDAGPNAPQGLTAQSAPPLACDCTNCSAEHCQPQPPKQPGVIRDRDITLEKGF
jgi:hypothetical protein